MEILVEGGGGQESGSRRPVTAEVVVGRDPDCDLMLDDPRVSRRHLRLVPDGTDRLRVLDLGSSNGTRINGKDVTGEVTASAGDRIELGSCTLIVQLTPSSTPPPLGGGPAPGPSAPPNAGSPPRTPAGQVPASPVRTPAPQQPVGQPHPHQRPRPVPDAGQRVAAPTGQPRQRVSADDSVVIRLRRAVRRSSVLAGVALFALVAGGIVLAVLLTRSEPTVEDIIASVAPATVLIVADDGAMGTGWVFDAAQGLIVTNHHVIGTGTSFEVRVSGQPRSASLLGTAPCEDLAVLRVGDTAGLETLELGEQSALRLGQTVIALGFPDNASLTDDLTATTGVVSVARSQFTGGFDVPDFPNVVQTDAAINPGNSGGPLVDLDSRLVGVNSAGRTINEQGRILQGQNFAVGVDRVREIVPDLVDGRSHGWTGALMTPVLFDDALFGVGAALVSFGAVPNTPAAAAGLRNTEVEIIAIDGRQMDGSLPTYCDAVGRRRSGDSAVFTVLPFDGGPTRDLTINFG